jgi:hypothetical protein
MALEGLYDGRREGKICPSTAPTSEETLAACEFALEWFEVWDQHADHEHDFGGEHAVMRRLRHTVRLAREAE